MAILNAVLRRFVDAVLAPFAGWPVLVSLSLVALVTAVGVLIVFKHTSNQRRMEDVKRRIHAGIFEIRLYSDDLRAIMRAQLEILRTNFTYLRLSMIPMVWVIVPIVLLMAQLQFHYGYEGLAPGHPVVLEVNLADAPSGRPQATLQVPDGLRAETQPIWLPSLNQLAWRVLPERNGVYNVGIQVGDAPAVSKRIVVGNRIVRHSPVRHAGGFVDSVLDPAEPPLPAGSPVRSIRVGYPEATVNVLGWHWQWMIPFFGLSAIFAFALRGPFKVTI
jgi:hypothetical protein